MAKKKTQNKQKNKTIVPPKVSVLELNESRSGGQIALRGYSYQFLYSCYLILNTVDSNTTFALEGIEDIDKIKYNNNDSSSTHIQLKYSTVKQDASFMDSVLKNYLEVYLIDPNRSFKLVYDFSVAAGHLSKLFASNLDNNSRKFWADKIDSIKEDNPLWKWNNYNFDDFLSKISFENVKKDTLSTSIEETLIKTYDITTNNIPLYANSLKLLCIDTMESRGTIKKADIEKLIESVKFDISQGVQNLAHGFIQRIPFSTSDVYSSDYYEGKKATASDIANNLPIERPLLEKEIADSIRDNTITVIKSSSGQGKTTLALRSMFSLRNEYTPYQIIGCNNTSDLGYIAEYFHMRTRIGEKPLILLDNLDAHLSEWNSLAKLMQDNVTYHYKLIITSRENDWYNYSGDISGLRSLHIVKPNLTSEEAEEIFSTLKSVGKIHEGITDWRHSWNKISEKQLLIEYVYLLTHGEMISDRISTQMKDIGSTSLSGIKFEILRKVCFADMCGIKLNTKTLLKNLSSKTDYDIGEILKSMTDEFLVHISKDGDYIEGLHPVRSQHIVNRLHEYVSLDETALSIASIVDKTDISVLFSHFSEFDLDKKTLYPKVVDMWWNLSDLSRFVLAIQGGFSGSVMEYFNQNRKSFDEAQACGGLYLVAVDLCPFAKFEEVDRDINALDRMIETLPDNENIKRLIQIRDSMPKFSIEQSDIYYLNCSLYQKLKDLSSTEITDIDSYATIVDWLYNMDSTMNLSPNINLDHLWDCTDKYSLKTVSSVMYSVFNGNRNAYDNFVESNISKILIYLKHKTHSHIINVSDDKKTIKVEYILRGSDIKSSVNESTSRLKNICRMLPIFETYCADAIKPHLELLDSYVIPDDEHKEMPIDNIVITFRQELNSLWINTIQSNYEFDTTSEWIEFWLNMRSSACELLEKSCLCMYKLLGNKKLGGIAEDFDSIHQKYNNMMTAPLLYPREHRPFETASDLPKLFQKAKGDYFSGIQNFANQLVDFLRRDEKFSRLAVYNLRTALASINRMQSFFDDIALESIYFDKHKDLCLRESHVLFETYICSQYYIQHLPNTRFNKYQVKGWHSSVQKALIYDINDTLSFLEDKYCALFPVCVYDEGIFSCYPIILKDFDLTNEDMMKEFILDTLPIAETSFDYMIMLCCNEKGELYNNALKIPKRLFSNIKEILNGIKEDELDPLNSPYPIEVSENILNCFECDLPIKPRKDFQPWHSHIGDIGEELWIYSKSRQLINSDEDKTYLLYILSSIKDRIAIMLGELKENVETELVTKLTELCNSVYDGAAFDNEEYNSFVSYIQSLNL